MESCPTQAVLPLVGLAAEKVIRDRHNMGRGGVELRRVILPGRRREFAAFSQ
ncbi:MAG: hypothetical protein R6U98_17815 [Pirellulaceae bacterium]